MYDVLCNKTECLYNLHTYCCKDVHLIKPNNYHCPQYTLSILDYHFRDNIYGKCPAREDQMLYLQQILNTK